MSKDAYRSRRSTLVTRYDMLKALDQDMTYYCVIITGSEMGRQSIQHEEEITKSDVLIEVN